jgi:multiple sugar transport system permease protein
MSTIIKALKKSVLPHMLLIFFAAIFIIPLVWQLSTSLKFPEDVYKMPPEFIPTRIRLDNYVDAFLRMPFLTYLKNTLIIAIVPIFGQILASSMAAYSLTKVQWKGRRILFPVIMATIMLPSQVTLIPVYVIWSKLGAINTFSPLLVPSLFGSAYYIFLLRQVYLRIPDSYIDSSRIDGAGELTILFRILMPLSKPILTTIVIFTFISGWNSFYEPLIYLNDGSMYTLAIGLSAFTEERRSQYELLMAASTLFMLPMIIVFFIGQKQFIKGIVLTGIK